MQKNTAMKICAAFAMLILSLPLISTVEAITFAEISAVRLLLYYAFSVVPITAGYLLYKLRLSFDKPGKIFLVNVLLFLAATAAAVFSVIFANFCGGFYSTDFNSFLIATEMIPTSLLWFYLGIKLNQKNFSDVFTMIWLGVFLAEIFLCYIFAAVENENAPALSVARKLMVYQLIIMAMITVLLINQTNIQTQINQRRNTSLIVPAGLRRYNAKLISVVGTVILAALLLKDVLAGFIGWFAFNTLKIIVEIINAIHVQQTPLIPPEEQIPDGVEELPINNDYNDLTLYIFLLITIVLIIVFRKKIVLLAKTIGQRIFGKYSKNPVKQEEFDYIDYYQPITVTERIAKKPTEKEVLKNYRKENDPVQKYRIGYKLILMWIKKRSNKLKSSFTVDSQKQLMEEMYHGQSDAKALCGTYGELRYDDRQPSEEQLGNMNGIISELYK